MTVLIKPLPNAKNAGEIINRVAAEVGVEPVTDPFGSSDPIFVQFTHLINSAGEELAIMFAWQQLQQAHQIITADTDSGDYPLPDDFSYMIDQTGWEQTQEVPLGGPLSAQDWTYLIGRDLVSFTIYASFRLAEGLFKIFPQPPPNGLSINFEYVSINWGFDPDAAGGTGENIDQMVKTNDVPMFNFTLMTRYLKVKYQEAKGIDSLKAQDSFNQMFSIITGQNMGGDILAAGRNRRSIPYLDSYRNTPDTNFGLL